MAIFILIPVLFILLSITSYLYATKKINTIIRQKLAKKGCRLISFKKTSKTFILREPQHGLWEKFTTMDNSMARSEYFLEVVFEKEKQIFTTLASVRSTFFIQYEIEFEFDLNKPTIS
jgi:hypothetical protein